MNESGLKIRKTIIIIIIIIISHLHMCIVHIYIRPTVQEQKKVYNVQVVIRNTALSQDIISCLKVLASPHDNLSHTIYYINISLLSIPAMLVF